MFTKARVSAMRRLNQAIAPSSCLNEARVSLKHRGIMPSAASVGEFRDMTTAFFEESAPAVFGLDFSSVSLIDLVASPEVRSLLEAATQAREGGRLIEAIEQTAQAFAELLDNYERGYRTVFGVHPFDSPIFLGSSLFELQDSSVRAFASAVQSAVEDLRAVTRILALGLDYHRYAKFRGQTPTITQVIGGGFVLSEREYEPAPTAEEVLVCQDFVIDCALRLQEIGTPLVPPERRRPPLQRQPRAVVRVEMTRAQKRPQV